MTATTKPRHTTGELLVEPHGGSGYKVTTEVLEPWYTSLGCLTQRATVDVLRSPSIPDSEREANARLFAVAHRLHAACVAVLTDPDILLLPYRPAWLDDMVSAVDAVAKAGS